MSTYMNYSLKQNVTSCINLKKEKLKQLQELNRHLILPSFIVKTETVL